MKEKEKRKQAAPEKHKNVDTMGDGDAKMEEVLPAQNLCHGSASAKSLTSQMTELSVSSSPVVEIPLSDAKDATDAVSPGQDIGKRIRTLKKKIRLAKAQHQQTGNQELKPEQLEKLSKLEGWRDDLNLLEDKKAELATS